MNGACSSTFLPRPLALGRGQISLNFNYKVSFKGLYRTLCVFSQPKDIKHIKREFHSVAWVMSQGGT